MTTIAAVRKGNRLSIAADTLSIFGSRRKETSAHIHDSEKIFSVGPNLMGVSGHPSWSLILKHYFSKNQITAPWKTPSEIFHLFNSMQEELKTVYHLTPPSLEFAPFESSEFQILIINCYGIFEVEYSRVVRQYSKYTAIGTGEDYALGAIHSLYNLLTDSEEIVKAGVEAAAKLDRQTEIPLYVRSIEM